MLKKLSVEMPDGSVWEVPAEFIARHRAEHYNEVDLMKGRQSSFEEELRYALEDDS